ncbi:MAG: proteasome assembly chaperone family protein [Candidatus Heimdallarchaeota archaeon]|nr:proteasome assembly chaperone family protein [Candidatus Heimdallarchaeota archaeon]
MTRINEIGLVDLKGKPLIQAFSGSGAIGTILSAFLIKAFEMEQVAVIHADSVPPVAMVRGGLIEHPIRLFQSEKLSLMTCEVSIPYNILPEFLSTLVEYYIEKEASYVVPVGGLPVLPDNYDNGACFGVVNNAEMLSFLENKNVPLLEEGVIYGSVVEALELCHIQGFNSCFALLAECDPGTASYHATEQILQHLAGIFEFEIDEAQFTEVTGAIKARIEESTRYIREDSLDKTRESHL